MAIDERARRRLYDALIRSFGAEEEATTLMEYLPPVGWADIATKEDLRNHEQRTGQRFDGVDQRFDGVDQRFDGVDQRLDQMDARLERLEGRLDALMMQVVAQTRTFVFATISAMATIAALAFAAARMV
jgi:hypothetical protein